MKKEVFNFLMLCVVFYLVIGFFSLMAMGYGYNISYMPFWHAPWEWLSQLLEWLVEGGG